MKLKKFFVNCYAALIRNREKRRAIRELLLNSHDKFVFVGGLLDHGNIDWGTYLLTHNMPEKVAALRRGLDEESNQLLDLIFSRMTIFPKGHYVMQSNYHISDVYLKSFLTPKELDDQKTYLQEWSQYNDDFPLDTPEYNPDIFLYHCGFKNKNSKLKKYIAGKDFIDGGAYIGDTALLYIKKYAPHRVYSFEISNKACKRYENTMRMNHIPVEQYQLCRLGLSDKKTEMMMEDFGHQGTSVLNDGNTKVQLTDLDSFALENNLHIGFIKTDLEGVGLEATLGMAETIKRDRPVLNIAMYHNPKEFFEIKPALEEITFGLGYKIKIEHHHPFNDRMYDINIFAYPEELNRE